MVQAN